MNCERFITLDNPALVKRQKDMVRKLATELKDVPNVYFEICTVRIADVGDIALKILSATP